MKVYIGPYKNWIGPYQITDAVFFWLDVYGHVDRWDYNLRDKVRHFLAHGFKDEKHVSWFHKVLLWIDSKRERKVKIRIDNYDTWSMDATLSPIILPMLKQLKATKHGSGIVDLEDVPENLRYTETETYDDQRCFDFYQEATDKINCDLHTRYDWILDEMIWAFEQLCDPDWQDQYWQKEPKLDLKKYPEDEGKELIPVRWETSGECDWIGRTKHQERIDNGLRLFGKYYQTLWD